MNEGRGISDINKIETNKIFDLFKNNGFKNNIHYSILNNEILIDFERGNYDSYFYKHGKNIVFHFTFPDNYNEVELKSIITHELNHYIEIFNIENKKYRYPNYDKIKKSLLKFNPETPVMEFFKHLIYKTLDNEINANVARTYTYLKSFDTIDEDTLKLRLEEYDLRKKYMDILNLNYKKILKDFDIENLEKLNNIFIENGVNEFFPFINNMEPIDKYIENWFKIIKSNTKKFISKQNKIIKEVIEDNEYSTNFKITEKNIFNYNNYIKNL